MAQNNLIGWDFHNYSIDFNSITAENFSDALSILLPQSKKEYEWLIHESSLTFKNLFDNMPQTERLQNIWQLLSTISDVKQTKELNYIKDEYSRILTPFFSEMSLNVDIYNKMKDFTSTQEFSQLNEEKQKLVNDIYLKGAQLQGVDLPEEKKQQLININQELSLLKNKFQNNLQQTRNSLFYDVCLEDLAGLPERQLKKIQSLSNNNGTYRIEYSTGLFSDILTYCDSVSVRQQVFKLSRQIGIQDGFDNRPLLCQIVQLQHQKANLLGYGSAAHMLMIKNMVKDPQEVLNFLDDIVEKSSFNYEKENQEYQDYAFSILKRKPQLYDRPYVLNKLEESSFSINHEEIKKYFPVEHVLKGFFNIFGNLYNIDFIETQENTWHSDVKVFELKDKNTKEALGKCYLDLYMRQSKRSGAYCSALVSRQVKDSNTIVKPITLILCNSQSEENSPALLSFSELTTLFHEFGHGFHGWLSKNELDAFNGTRNVQRDAVELPSQFMENFCYDYDVLKQLSCHIETKEVLPYDKFQNILASKQFLGATQIVRQSILSKFDMLTYFIKDSNPMEVEREVMQQWINYTDDLDNLSIAPYFHHIFTAGYSAGYYVYKWAEVYSCDAYAALKEKGSTLEEQFEMAQKFRTTILEPGGLYDMRENYQKFRGKSADIKYLLKDYGIIAS